MVSAVVVSGGLAWALARGLRYATGKDLSFGQMIKNICGANLESGEAEQLKYATEDGSRETPLQAPLETQVDEQDTSEGERVSREAEREESEGLFRLAEVASESGTASPEKAGPASVSSDFEVEE